MNDHYPKMSRLLIILICSSMAFFISCKSSREISNKTEEDQYLVLISLDGMRWDYVDRFKPPHLSGFIEKGVKAKSLIPSFPSKTFPNHYTIATGLYPDHHGLLGNVFYHHEKDVIYNTRDRTLVEDGSFYGGTPIWVHAHNNGLVTASFFFVGSEANIQGIHPTYYYNFDDSIPNDTRIKQVLEWLSLPEKDRPRLITLYFSDMDKTGHRHGPNNDLALGKSLFDLDEDLGKLFRGIKQSDLPVNVIIVSDHGMAEVDIDHFIPTEKLQNDDLYTTIDNGAIVNIHLKEGINEETALNYLNSIQGPFKAYRTESTPHFEYQPQNKDWGEIQVMPDEGYYFSNIRGINMRKRASWTTFGQHGYDPDMKDMHGIFYANGPVFKEGYTISSIKNIHIYPLMCKVLGLQIPEGIDGDYNKIRKVLFSD